MPVPFADLQLQYQNIKDEIDGLLRISESTNDEIREELQKIVPQFRPQSVSRNRENERKAA